MAHETQKEQAKLTANYINGIAITVFALGCASPILAGVYGTAPLGTDVLQISIVTAV